MIVCSWFVAFCGSSWSFADGSWPFAGGLWSFVIVACLSNYEIK